MTQIDEVTKNRLHLRRAGVWAAIAFAQSRRAELPQAAAQRALDELAAVDKRELGDDEQADYTEAAIRVGAVRWAALPVAPAAGKAADPRAQRRTGPDLRRRGRGRRKPR